MFQILIIRQFKVLNRNEIDTNIEQFMNKLTILEIKRSTEQTKRRCY